MLTTYSQVVKKTSLNYTYKKKDENLDKLKTLKPIYIFLLSSILYFFLDLKLKVSKLIINFFGFLNS